MKKVSDFLSTTFVLFIIGSIVYGGIKEGHTVQIVFILGIVIFLIYLSGVREENKFKQQQLNLEKENHKIFDEKLERFKLKIYHFAYSKNKLSRVTYDIEEGGVYHWEYDKNTCRIIDNIIKKNIQFPKDNFELISSKIQSEILEMPNQSKERYVGL